MDNRNKKNAQILFFIFSATVFFISFVYKGSEGANKVSRLNSKNNTIESLNTEVVDNEQKITSFMEELKNKQKSLSHLSKEAEKSKRYLDTIDLELHLPSFLVDLGLKAQELNIDLTIDYNDKQVLTGVVEEQEQEEEIDEDKLVEEKIKEELDVDKKIEEDKKKEKEKEDTKESEERPRPTEVSYYYDGNLHTLEQMSIPLRVSGRYNDIRAFLYYIDNLNTIDSRSINLTSNGDVLEGDIIIHLFYKGVRK